MVCNKMNIKTVMTDTKYLGLLVVYGRSKKVISLWSLRETEWLEREGVVKSRERGVDQGRGTSNSQLHH